MSLHLLALLFNKSVLLVLILIIVLALSINSVQCFSATTQHYHQYYQHYHGGRLHHSYSKDITTTPSSSSSSWSSVSSCSSTNDEEVVDAVATKDSLKWINNNHIKNNDDNNDNDNRRSFIMNNIFIFNSIIFGNQLSLLNNIIANAAVGTLPELSTTNSIIQGITIKVADQSQYDSMIQFLIDGFNCIILRKRKSGTVDEIWLGYGPEKLSIPKGFTIPINSFNLYGGHASIHIVYDSKQSTPYYRTGDENLPGNNIAYIQLGVLGYRISQILANGGVITDAYGIVDVISPSGIPFRGIVGYVPDPIMLIAINCINVKECQTFYKQFGFIEQEYPYARPNKGLGQFEPLQPKNSIYISQSNNSLGILLLPINENQNINNRNPFKRNNNIIIKNIIPNPVLESLNIVYTPTTTTSSDDNDNMSSLRIVDPSGVPLQFQSILDFEIEEKATR